MAWHRARLQANVGLLQDVDAMVADALAQRAQQQPQQQQHHAAPQRPPRPQQQEQPPLPEVDAVRLDAEQQAAAVAPLGQALAVVAGAGSGKTTTMIERVVFLMRQVGGQGARSCAMTGFPRTAQQGDFESGAAEKLLGAAAAPTQ